LVLILDGSLISSCVHGGTASSESLEISGGTIISLYAMTHVTGTYSEQNKPESGEMATEMLFTYDKKPESPEDTIFGESSRTERLGYF